MFRKRGRFQHAAILIAVLAATATSVAMYGPVVAASNPDGTYKGKNQQSTPVKFKVAKGGKLIKNYNTGVYATCYSPITGLSYRTFAVGIAKIKVKGDGSFKKTIQQGGSDGPSFKETVTGKLKGTRVTNGTVKVSGTCNANLTYTAKRK